MKRLFFILIAALMTASVWAEYYPTKFLGIPVDGTKEEMIRKIQDKGFIYNRQADYFLGRFNGENVIVMLRTYNGKVCQVMVCDMPQAYSEKQIRDRFNNLMKQFNNNPNYMSATLDQTYIDEKERVLQEISRNGKKYTAYYVQITHELDTAKWMKDMERIALDVATQLADRDSLTEQEKDIAGEYIEQKALRQQYLKNLVRFSIVESQGKYSIALYYDNLYNQPIGSGSDL